MYSKSFFEAATEIHNGIPSRGAQKNTGAACRPFLLFVGSGPVTGVDRLKKIS